MFSSLSHSQDIFFSRSLTLLFILCHSLPFVSFYFILLFSSTFFTLAVFLLFSSFIFPLFHGFTFPVLSLFAVNILPSISFFPYFFIPYFSVLSSRSVSPCRPPFLPVSCSFSPARRGHYPRLLLPALPGAAFIDLGGRVRVIVPLWPHMLRWAPVCHATPPRAPHSLML